MTALVEGFEHFALELLWAAVALAVAMTLAIVIERVALAVDERRLRRAERDYGPLIARALRNDGEAGRALVESPSGDRLAIARLLITPLIEDRDRERLATSRDLVRRMELVPVAGRMLRSYRWWQRALALRALGLIQLHDQTARIVAALDDSNADVRNSALDALADMQNPAALPAIVVRLHDASLARGRRLAALAAYGPQGESFLLELAQIDAEHRLNYARALAVCGTSLARPALCAWTADERVEVRASAFEALARVGLDQQAASLALGALEAPDVHVRAMAAAALSGWTEGDSASRVARHLDDVWAVAVPAARSLRSMGELGRIELQASAGRTDLAGVLARQMLWEAEVRR
jgi:HEAT repeat protein